ncbi:MAG: PRD domain-containing protein [Coriobacteriales bacterium]|nr:PRD domain-containing protein [Coriobacteriales bacterium]
MKSLFSDNRLANVLHTLKGTQVVSVKALASKFDVSDRTVRNDIKALNSMLGECAFIDGQQGRYTLRVFDERAFMNLLAKMDKTDDFLNSPRNRMDYMFGKLMRADSPLLTDELAYEMSVGRTTLINDLKRLRAEIDEYHLVVEGKTNRGLTLYGNETDIRRYVLDTNFDSIYENYPLDAEVEDALLAYFDEYALEVDAKRSFRRMVVLMLDRFLTGHYIGKLSGQAYDLVSRSEFAVVSDVVDKIGASLTVEIPTEEKIFAFMAIIGMRTPADIHGMRSIELDESIRPLLPLIVEQISRETNLNISLGDFTEEFLYHLMFMINRMRFKVRLQNPMKEDMREKYPLAYQVAGIAAKVITQTYGFEVTEDEQAYLATYFGVFLTESQLRMEKSFRIVAIYTTGRVTARLIEMQLRRVIGAAADLTMLSAEEVTAERLEEFDLVLTTVELAAECNRPVIQISEVIQEQELRRKIEKARYWEQTESPTLDANWFVSPGLLGERQFFLFDGTQSYEEALQDMVERLESDGLVDDGFYERLSQRGSMVLGNGIALPHAVQHVCDRLALAVAIFERPVSYRENEISTVFLLCLPKHIEDNDYLLIRVYDEIITISQDDELRESIARARTYQQLRRVMFRNEV